MGFWHTGYMEHHEADYFGRVLDLREPLPPPVFSCPHCSLTFDDRFKLEHHLFNGHPFARPLLLFRGRECGRARLTVTDVTEPGDWVVVDCDRLKINGLDVEPDAAGECLAEFRNTVVDVTMLGAASVEVADLEFAVADPADLDQIDGRLLDLVRGHRLSTHAVQGFLSSTEPFGTGHRYRDGIATYLYGVLAREQAADSGLARDEYRNRFEESVNLLHTFNRPASDAVCGLVSFHFNQFDQASRRTRSPRVAWAAERFAKLLGGNEVADSAGPAPERAGLDFVLSDVYLERVLVWTCHRLDDRDADLIDEMEGSMRALEPFDRLKAHVLCAEHARTAGLIACGRRHANELRNNLSTADWARTYLSDAKMQSHH